MLRPHQNAKINVWLIILVLFIFALLILYYEPVLSFLNNLLQLKLTKQKIYIKMAHLIFFIICIIITFLFGVYLSKPESIISKIFKKVIFYMTPIIGFISFNVGKKAIKYCCNQDDLYSYSYLNNLRLLRICYLYASLVLIPFILLSFLLPNHYLFFSGTAIAFIEFTTKLIFHKFPFTTPTKEDKNAKNLISFMFYTISVIFFIVEYFAKKP